jgi:alkylation response protein AidB-like acyl-CoA dehydrogenase
MYEKAGDLGLLGVAVPEAYGGWNGVCINYVGLRLHFWLQDLSQLLLEHIRESVLCNFYMVLKRKNKNTYLN